MLTGYAPVVTMQDYKQEVSAYTRGFGRLSFTLRGYEPCHNAEEVIAASGYDPEADPFHTADSVFCAHGSGYIVPWYEVKQNMHVGKSADCQIRRGKAAGGGGPGTLPPQCQRALAGSGGSGCDH